MSQDVLYSSSLLSETPIIAKIIDISHVARFWIIRLCIIDRWLGILNESLLVQRSNAYSYIFDAQVAKFCLHSPHNLGKGTCAVHQLHQLPDLAIRIIKLCCNINLGTNAKAGRSNPVDGVDGFDTRKGILSQLHDTLLFTEYYAYVDKKRHYSYFVVQGYNISSRRTLVRTSSRMAPGRNRPT